jgi:dihydrodipicolinate synthase/N-acetylneuraminate lyase
MPLHLYPDVYASGSVPANWLPAKGGAIKYPVRNDAVRRHLRSLLPGKWKKVIKYGNTGEVHYFEHESGQVAGVKFFPKS